MMRSHWISGYVFFADRANSNNYSISHLFRRTRQPAQDAEMQLEKIKPSKADCVFRSFRWGDDLHIYRKVDFEEEHHTQRSFFLECQLRALESWNLVVTSWPMAPMAWRWTSQVLKDGEKLLHNLEDVFRCSWARPRVLGVSVPRRSRTSFNEVQGTEKSCRVYPLVI